MDPIHPIAPGPPLIPRGATVPVERLERISRERDRPAKERRERRDPAYKRSGQPPEGDGLDDDGLPHVDVTV
jgi:hypothetical protein